MSLVGLLVISPLLLAVLLLTPHHINYQSQDLLISSLCHAVYNTVSLTLVLAVFNPVQHSLINVGERNNTMITLSVFSECDCVMSLCLLVCVSAVRAVREQWETKGTNNTKYWAGILVR